MGTLKITLSKSLFVILFKIAMKGKTATVNNRNANYAIKIEPKDNGPLFCELHFYSNCGKKAD